MNHPMSLEFDPNVLNLILSYSFCHYSTLKITTWMLDRFPCPTPRHRAARRVCPRDKINIKQTKSGPRGSTFQLFSFNFKLRLNYVSVAWKNRYRRLQCHISSRVRESHHMYQTTNHMVNAQTAWRLLFPQHAQKMSRRALRS